MFFVSQAFACIYMLLYVRVVCQYLFVASCLLFLFVYTPHTPHSVTCTFVSSLRLHHRPLRIQFYVTVVPPTLTLSPPSHPHTITLSHVCSFTPSHSFLHCYNHHLPHTCTTVTLTTLTPSHMHDCHPHTLTRLPPLSPHR